MRTVHLRSIAENNQFDDPRALTELEQLRELSARDVVGRYKSVDDPATADIILFVESMHHTSPAGWYLEHVRRDPVFRKYRGKSFVYSGFDFPIPFVRGIFPSLERGFHGRSWARSGPYLERNNNNVFASYCGRPAPPPEERILASFVGCLSNQEARRRLLDIKDDSIRVLDNTTKFIEANHSGRVDEVQRLYHEFAETMWRSKFVLCPRGYGASSFRLFETMQMGRSPVIISDAWTPPEGPAWGEFSLHVPERDILKLPQILRSHESESEEWGRRARKAWEDWFSPDRLFDRLCGTCDDMLAGRKAWDRFSGLLCLVQLARPRAVKMQLRGWKRGSWRPAAW